MARSPPNIHSKVPRRACTQNDLKVTVKVKGHVIGHFCHVTKIDHSRAQIAQSQPSREQTARSSPNWHMMVPAQACSSGVLKVKVEVKGHVIRALSSFHENRSYSRANWSIATKLGHDGPWMGLHLECAQGHGQGQSSRDMGTFVMSQKLLILTRKLLDHHQSCSQ